jgi:serine/threonine protein kinase/dienelactone hydrolase
MLRNDVNHLKDRDLKQPHLAPTPGQMLGPYRIVGQIGSGGMGVVYLAEDQNLKRKVAIKVLSAEFVGDTGRVSRFQREAEVLASLSHPHIASIYSIQQHLNSRFLVLEFIDGETLSARLARGPMTVPDVLQAARQIADGLQAAHAQGIVHRDLKPANVMLTRSGVAKILDFGLAKLEQKRPPEEVLTQAADTAEGAVLGTASYMSPEQAEGEDVDARSDIFSYGALLYEMLTARRAFSGKSTLSILSAVLRTEPQPIESLAPQVPAELAAVITRCLRKDPAQRFQTMAQVLTELNERMPGASPPQTARNDRRRIAFRRVAAAIVVGAIAMAGWSWQQSRTSAWTYEKAVPEIRRLVEKYDYVAALPLLVQAIERTSNDPELEELLQAASVEIPITTMPSGLKVAIRAYGSSETSWNEIGVSPIEKVRIARGPLEWRFSGSSGQTYHRLFQAGAAGASFTLSSDEQTPDNMVYIPAARNLRLTVRGLSHHSGLQVPEFYLDEFEVTNKQYKQFVDQGGYRKPEFWKEPFKDGNKVIPRTEAMARLTDKTGQAGPSTWELGDYPSGQENFPVTGVSWYEAAAYAASVGKMLPPIAYWIRAAQPTAATHLIVPASNFDAPRAVDGSRALNVFGTHDMAGGAKEWCLNEAGSGSGRYYILGGSWSDPSYIFGNSDAQNGFAREPGYGFRLAKNLSGAATPPDLAAPADAITRNYLAEKPVSDEVFRSYSVFYDYDKTALEPEDLESRDEKYWTRHKVAYRTAYNNERMSAFLFLPKNAAPPFQTIVYFPGAGAQTETDPERIEMWAIPFLVRSGRAVLYPIYKGTYERGGGIFMARNTMAHRDRRIEQYMDLARSIDYLETRTDIDANKIGYYGVSWGAGMGAHFPALEKRFKVSILAIGGFGLDPISPEVDPFNFAPRVTVPTLMLNGRYDFTFPIDVAQLPMLRLLGTPPEHKRHRLFDIGHSVLPIEFARESLPWLDRYLGRATP